MRGAVVRRARATELEVLAELHAASFGDVQSEGMRAWSARELAGVMSLPGSFAALALHRECPAGLALGRAVAEEAEILTLGVAPPHRRFGIASLLLGHCMLEARAFGASRLFLEVGESNRPAIELYFRHHFTVVGRRKGYYAQGADGIIMRLNLQLDRH